MGVKTTALGKMEKKHESEIKKLQRECKHKSLSSWYYDSEIQYGCTPFFRVCSRCGKRRDIKEARPFSLSL